MLQVGEDNSRLPENRIQLYGGPEDTKAFGIFARANRFNRFDEFVNGKREKRKKEIDLLCFVSNIFVYVFVEFHSKQSIIDESEISLMK